MKDSTTCASTLRIWLSLATYLVLDVMAYFPLNQHASACCKDMHAPYFAWSRQEFCRRKTQMPLLVVVDDILTEPPWCQMMSMFAWDLLGCFMGLPWMCQIASAARQHSFHPFSSVFIQRRFTTMPSGQAAKRLLVAGHQFRVPVSGALGWICFSKCLGHVYIECACTEAFELRDTEEVEPFLNCKLLWTLCFFTSLLPTHLATPQLAYTSLHLYIYIYYVYIYYIYNIYTYIMYIYII